MITVFACRSCGVEFKTFLKSLIQIKKIFKGWSGQALAWDFATAFWLVLKSLYNYSLKGKKSFEINFYF